MRSGKTKMAGWMGTYELHKLLEILEKGMTFAEYYKSRGVSIGIGQRIYIVVVAAALDQTEGTIFSAIKGLVENAPWFVKYVKYLKSKKLYSADKFELRFFNTLHVKAEDSNSATQVGKTIHTLIFDEMSRMDVAESEIAKKSQKASAQMVYQGLSKGTTTFKKDRNVIIISAPVFEDDYGMHSLLQSGKLTCCEETEDVIMTLSRKHPTKIPSRLGHHSTTFAFNPTIDRDTDPFILGVKSNSPLSFKRDYLAIPPSGVNTFFDDADKIDACVTAYEKDLIKEINYSFEESFIDGTGNTIKKFYVGKSPEEIQANNFTSYFLCCDAAVRKDNFAFGIGHGEWVTNTDNSGKIVKKSKTVIDYLTMWRPDRNRRLEVNLENVMNFISVLKKHMHIQALTFDQWNADIFLQKMHSMGIPTRQLPITMIMWEKLREKVNNNLLSIPHPKHGQLIDVERPEKGTQYDLVIQEMKKLQLIQGREVDHPASGCFVGETIIPMLDGTCSEIKDLVGKEVWVYSAKPNGEIVPGKARGRLTKYTNKIISLVLDSGASIRCTPEHPFMLKNGSYKMAKDLRPGIDRLMPINLIWPVNGGYERITDHTGKRTLTHKLVAEATQRKLEDYELVHHKNGIKTDNTPDNLEILSKTDHAKMHTVDRHSQDPDYRKALSEGTIRFNQLDSTRLKRSLSMKSRSREWYLEKIRTSKTFRSDITLESLLNVAKDLEAINANSAARILNCGRNVVVRVLRENGYSSYDELLKVIDNNHKIRHMKEITLDIEIPVYDLEVDTWDNFALQAGVIVHNSKDLADVVARINFLVDESTAMNNYSMKGIDPNDFINTIGGSDKFRESLRQLTPILNIQNEGSGTGRFFAVKPSFNIRNKF